MDLELTDKRVLITGGSRGIGLACAHAFLREGAKVAIIGRSEANLAAARTVRVRVPGEACWPSGGRCGTRTVGGWSMIGSFASWISKKKES